MFLVVLVCLYVCFRHDNLLAFAVFPAFSRSKYEFLRSVQICNNIFFFDRRKGVGGGVRG